MIYRILRGEPIQIYGDGRNIREWIHVDDNCKAITTVLKYGSKGEIYNIGSGIEKTNNEIAGLLIDISESTIKPTIEFIEDRKGHDYRYSVDFSKVMKLGFKPEIELESGLEKTFNWYKAFFSAQKINLGLLGESFGTLLNLFNTAIDWADELYLDQLSYS